MQKPTIAVLFGSASPEYDVSLKSAYSIISHMAQYDPLLIGISKLGEWFHFTGSPERILDDTWHNPCYCKRAIISPCRQTGGVLVFEPSGARTIKLDAALPIIHGKNGEDGTIQGLLELAGIPVIGSGSGASALCMDKAKAHAIVEAAGFRVARSFVASALTPCETAHFLAEQTGYPLFVKPVNAGSSFGISKVFEQAQLLRAIDHALAFDSAAIIEETIEGFEVGAAILEAGDQILVGAIDEIELAGDFFDYTEKYTLKTSAIHVPARIPEHKAQEIKAAARTIYQVLGCRGFARIDLFLSPNGALFFNEVNTIPGFTQQSRYPNMLKAAGMTFEQIVETMIAGALKESLPRVDGGVPVCA